LVAAGSVVVTVAALAGSALAAPQRAAAAPTATTGPTTVVGSSSATVTGSVNPGGQTTTWYVEYGTSSSYGSKTTAKSAGSGSSTVSVSADLTGLHVGTTYHYRFVATSSSGTSHGGDGVFTTTVPPDVVTGSPSSVGASTATLNGTVDPNGRETTFYFEYGTSTSYGTKTPARSAGSATTPQSESVGINGLQAGRTYHFRLVASSDAGTSTGKDVSFITSSAPAVVTADATSVAPTSATLRGSVTPNGLATTWWFEYGTSTSYRWKTSAHSAGSGGKAVSVSAAVSGLQPATTYHFRLVAQNSSGRAYGADRSFSAVGPPSVQTGSAQSIGPDAAVVTGALDTRGRSTSWWFQYGTSTSYGKSTPARSAGSAAGTQRPSTTLGGLAPATTYHYRLVAKSDAGTTTGADATFTTAGVTLTVATRQVVYGGRITLSGVVPTHNAGEQVTIFSQSYGGGSFLLRSTVLTGPNGTWAFIASPRIGTTYEASWRGGMSAAVAIGVHPAIALRQTASRRFVVHVTGARSFARRLIQVQRLSYGRWRTIRRIRLGARSGADFRISLPKGRSTIRIALSVNQAGAGFLGGKSRAITVRR
jgi:phosphodiesterase/alkaline phosphatase D-like protein